jgi:hypothetical protein
LSRLQKIDFFLNGLTLKYVKAPTIVLDTANKMTNKTLITMVVIYVFELMLFRLVIVKWLVGTMAAMEIKIKKLSTLVRELFMKLLLKWMTYRTIKFRSITIIRILKISRGTEML